MREKHEILIIGGGISGISCASQLFDNDFEDFHLVESNAKLGGRVSSVNISGIDYSLGPSFLHGIENNPLAKIAIGKLDLKTHPDQETDPDNVSDTLFLLDGQDKTEEFSSASGELDICVNSMSYEFTQCDRISTDDADFFDKVKDIPLAKALSICGWKADTPAKRIAEVLLYDISSGGRSDILSSAVEVAYAKHEEDYLLVDPIGFLKIFQEMIPKEEEFSKKYTCGFHVASIVLDEASNSYIVTSSDGRVIECKYIVMTVSLGVLKAGSIHFKPPLPVEKVKSLDYFQMSDYTKIFVEFDNVFWHDIPYLFLLSESSNKDFCDNLHEARGLTFWINFNHFNKDSRVISAHVSGEWAHRVRTMARTDLVSLITEIFRKAYPTAAFSIKDVSVNSWMERNTFLGSFPVAKHGITKEILDNLIKPISNRIFFAGDYTRIDELGTSQAAYKSGKRAAELVLECAQ